MKFGKLLTFAAALGSAAAFWRMECRGRSGLARIDPLVSPGEISQHVHTLHGSSGLSEVTDYSDLIGANCTSCAVTEDKSAYWTPALYFRYGNGSYELVEQVGGMLAYYFLNYSPGSTNITAFPEGFRMIAGDNSRRNYTITGENATTDASIPDPPQSFWAELNQTTQNDLAQRAIGFNCLNYQKPPEGSLYRHYLPAKDYLDANCADGIRMELSFPACWNGKDLDSPNHQDHVAYPDLVLNGDCPPGFEVRLPGLFYETIWATNNYVGIDGTFVIANGDIEGFGYHGDFMMGWPNQTFLQDAVDTCTNTSGLIEDCPLFSIVDEAVQSACSIQEPANLATDLVSGIVGTSLPGNLAIQYGPGPATLAHPPSTPTGSVSIPTETYSPGSTASVSGIYKPGDIIKKINSTTIASSASSAAPIMTSAITAPTGSSSASSNSAAAVTTSSPGSDAGSVSVSTFSTQYVTVGNVVSEIIWVNEVVYVTETEEVATTTVTVDAKKERRSHDHFLGHRVLHGHGHGY